MFILSGGNVDINNPADFPDKNKSESIHDPSQSFNAITVGSYTRKDRIDAVERPGWLPLARNGGMSPSNSTSIRWDNQWSNKPDIVMEGGNKGAYLDATDYLGLLKNYFLYDLQEVIFKLAGISARKYE